MNLQDQVVAVTGAFGQLGRAVVAQLQAQGARVALLDIVPGEAPAGAAAWQVDLASLAEVRGAFDAIAQRFGAIDGLVNVAGGFRWQPLAQSEDLGEWAGQFAVNLLTCVTASKAVLPHLQRAGRGRIVNIGSAAAVKAAGGMGAYAASKSGVARLTESLADELKSQGITVNAVLPGVIDTPANRREMPDADRARWVMPAQVAGVIAFLLSDAASAVTGALLPVTGRA